MTIIPLILTLHQEVHLKQLQTKEKFSVALSAVNQLTKIGNLNATKAVRTFSANEMFSPKREKDFNCIFEKDTGRYWMGAGEFSPSVMIYNTGQIASYSANYNEPHNKQVELAASELRNYASQAMRIIAPPMGMDTIEFVRTKSLYSTTESQLADPQIDLEATRKTNGIPWGPGRWGKVVLINYTGEVVLAMANRTFSRIEDSAGVMSQDECSHYAASAVLSIKGKECIQTSLTKTGGKFITGNPFLGGQYFTGSDRAKKIMADNLGVLAYEYQFGNGDAMVNGQYSVLYEVIVDARTGAALRIRSPMALGVGPGARSRGWSVPTTPVNVGFRNGKVSDHLKSVHLTKIATTPEGSATSWTMQIGQSYWQAERIGKNFVKIDGTYYQLK